MSFGLQICSTNVQIIKKYKYKTMIFHNCKFILKILNMDYNLFFKTVKFIYAF
jgi:hypothetical protein